jgi:hypothetical protein
MPLTCNIDGRGKLIRLICGIVALGAGIVVLLAWALGSAAVTPWLISLVLTVGGAFAIFEARAGWCVVRAMGVRTPF